MDKKSFFKGLAAGAAAVIVIGVGFVFATGFGTALAGENLGFETKASYIMGLLDRLYVEDIDVEEMNEAMYRAMVSSVGDKYTEYFTAEEFENYLEQSQGTFYGVGITVTEMEDESGVYVVNVIDDSPAQAAGILAGDVIHAVDGEDITDLSLDSAVSLMKGEKDTEVTLTIYRESIDQDLEFKIIRDEVNQITVGSQMIDDIGYIQITGFKKNTYNEFKDNYDSIMAENPKGLIIDVRSNPGGLFDVVGEVVDDLVGEGVYVYTIDKNGNKEEQYSDAKMVEVPLVVLVNENSASASEILAGAVQDMKAGVLVGNTTYGKGLVQGIYKIPDGSGVKITIQKYYTPRGVCIQGEGITPDYEVDLPEGYIYNGSVNLEKDTQLLKAIEILSE